MLHHLVTRQSGLQSTARFSHLLFKSCHSTQSKVSDPLRILFCGSDEFSCESLKALHVEHERNVALIRSIDVVVRPPKPSGRGLKLLRQVPLRKLAMELNLPIHERDTFTGWNMPQPSGELINLIIAVSFGLFVPPRLLHTAKYGGLNIHPSLLPDLRGPAPLHHALLLGRSHTGVSLQTLSPHTFDAGIVLSQTPLPGIPISSSDTLSSLHSTLASTGASMLIEGLRAGVHVPPHTLRGRTPSIGEESFFAHAPKIHTADRALLQGGEGVLPDAGAVVRRARALGPLWAYVSINQGKLKSKRIIFEDIHEAPAGHGLGSLLGQSGDQKLGRVRVISLVRGHGERSGLDTIPLVTVLPEDGGNKVAAICLSGDFVLVGRIKVEGEKSRPAGDVLRGLCSE